MLVLGGGAFSYERGTPVAGHTKVGVLTQLLQLSLGLFVLTSLTSLVSPGAHPSRVHSTCGPISPYSGRDCVKSLRPSFTGLYRQQERDVFVGMLS